MVLDGQLDSTYAYSFIVTDIPTDEKSTTEVEHFHRHRAQIEERFKDAKLGQPLRHLPSGDMNANRVWLTASLRPPVVGPILEPTDATVGGVSVLVGVGRGLRVRASRVR